MDTQKTISVLNDLLHITNDRIRGFGNVEGKVWEMYSNLKGAYDGMITQSKIMRVELIDLITARGGEAEDTVSLAQRKRAPEGAPRNCPRRQRIKRSG